eukprot:134117_1
MEQLGLPKRAIIHKMKTNGINDEIIAMYEAFDSIPSKDELISLDNTKTNSLNKIYKSITNRNVFHVENDRDKIIALKYYEKLKKKRHRNEFEIFKIIARIMDAQYIIKIRKTRNKNKDTIKKFINKSSLQIQFVIEYINAFEKHCDIKLLKHALDLALCTPELKAFAPMNGQYKQHIFTHLKEENTLIEIMKLIGEKESEKIDAKIISFAYEYLKRYYSDNFSDKDEFNESNDDIMDDYIDKEWMYRILLSHNSDPNFECNSGGLSPIAYTLTHLFEYIYVSDELVTRGAILQARETSKMVNIFVGSAFQKDSERYLNICQRICRKSDIKLCNIIDKNGNNPIHLAVLKSDDNINIQKNKQINYKFIQQKMKALQLLIERYPIWLTQKNNNNMYPLSMTVKFRDMDSMMCLGAMCAGNKYFFSMISEREFVYDLIVWVIAILSTSESSQKWDINNYTKLMQVELIFNVFDYKISFTWPNKHQKTNDIIHIDEFEKDNINLKPFSLISICYEKKIYRVIELLTTEFNILRYLSANEHLQVNEMQNEIREFAGKMFVEGRKKFEVKWERDILDKIKNEMLLENDFGNPQLQDIANRFINKPNTIQSNDNIDNNGEDIKQRAVSWIEVIYSTTVEGLSTADFITDILILRDLWLSNNLWWTTFMLSLLIAPYLVCYSALGSLIQHRMNFIFLTMSISDEINKPKCSVGCKWFSFNLLVLLLMTPLCIVYFVVIDIVFMIYIIFATIVFFMSCTKWDIGDVMDDWVFKKIFGLNRMQIIGYRRLRTLSQLFFETIPQIFLQLRILWQLKWANNDTQNQFQIDANSIIWSVGFAILHLIFEAAIISLDSAASQMKFIHYAIVCLGARLDWIPFSHLFIQKGREIQDIIDEKDYLERIDIRREYFICENEDIKSHEDNEAFNYEEISSGLFGLRYKLEFQFSNESMN